MNEIKGLPSRVALILVTAFMFFPLYIVFVMGTYYSEDIFRGLPIWFSDYFFENLKVVMHNNYDRAYLNSLMVSAFSVVSSVLVSSLIGYALAKFQFRLKKFLFGFLIIIMMIPTQISIIGFVREMKALNLVGTLVPIMLGWVAHPLGAFFMTQFIRDSVPDEIIESARIDGCSEPGVFFQIVIPCIKPGVLTLSTLVFLWSWNAFMVPLVIINKQSLYTIPLMIQTLSTVFRTDYGAIMCALSISILPIIMIFSLTAKTFVSGIAAGAVKG